MACEIIGQQRILKRLSSRFVEWCAFEMMQMRRDNLCMLDVRMSTTPKNLFPLLFGGRMIFAGVARRLVRCKRDFSLNQKGRFCHES